MRITSYNLNGIRSAMKKDLLLWLSENPSDIVCFQELKANHEQFEIQSFENLGYYCNWFPAEKKGYSGVGLLSKTRPDRVVIGCGIEKFDREGRILRADFGDFTQISVYFPSGTTGEVRQEFKMEFLDFFYNWIENLMKERPKLIISGDYNICHEAIDIHDPIRNAHSSGFLPEEREWFSEFLELGFTDTYRTKFPGVKKYSWWSFRAGSRSKNLGWRIDYHLVSKPLEDLIISASINNEAVHSDHCPVIADLDIQI